MSKWLEIKAATATKPTEIMIYGDIGDWWEYLDATSLATKIKSAGGDVLHVRINSGGGSVFTAQAVYSVLRSTGKRIEAFIDGIAASAATIISSAADVVHMPENALFMVHQPLLSTYGNADELREAADLLDKVRDTMIAAYRNKTGLDDAKIIELLSFDNWMTAAEAKEHGFVDEISQPFEIAASIKNDNAVVNGVKMKVKHLPENFTRNGVKNMDLKALKESHPEAYAAVVAAQEDAVKAERERVKQISASTLPGFEALAAEAIEAGTDAGAFALQLIEAQKKQGTEFLANRQTDTPAAPQTPAQPVNAGDNDAFAKAIAAAANKKLGA